MAEVASTNFASGLYPFVWMTDSSTDPITRTQVSVLAQAVDAHDHSAGYGPGVKRLQTTSAPAAAGEVRVSTDEMQWYGTALQTAVRLAGTQTITGDKTFSGAVALGQVTGNVFLNDTANANSTLGLTINQGSSDNEILALKSSDVAHGITSITETDTFFGIGKLSVTTGGAYLQGYAGGTSGVLVSGLHVTDDTTKTTSSNGAVNIRGGLKSGTSITNLAATANIVTIQNNGTTRFTFGASGVMNSIGSTASDQVGNGVWYLNDTSNADVTLGLTLNQGANDDQILAFKSSDVAHGATTNTETDTYGFVDKYSATGGGLQFTGVSELNTGLSFRGVCTSEDSTRSTAGVAPINLTGQKISGSAFASVGANVNVVTIGAGGTTRFIFDSDGDSHQDVGTAWTNYDTHDDIHLLNTLASEVARPGDPIKDEFRSFLTYNREALEQARLVTFNDDGHHFVNMSKLTMLLVGAVRQMGLDVSVLRGELSAVKALMAGA